MLVLFTSGVQIASERELRTVWKLLLVTLDLLVLPPSQIDSTSSGASALLFLSSLPRVTKGPVPIALAVTSAAAGFYYGKTVYNLREQVI